MQQSVTALAVPGVATSTAVLTIEFVSTKPVMMVDIAVDNQTTGQMYSFWHGELPDRGVTSGTLDDGLSNTHTGNKLYVLTTYYFTDGTSFTTDESITVE